MNLISQINDARLRIKPFLSPTPLIRALGLSKLLNCEIYLKLENLQPTYSFKVRGAFNKLLSLTEIEKKQGIVTASTGNHGAAIAYAADLLKIKNLICVPKNANPTKIENIRRFNGSIHFHGNESGETEKYARNFALKNNMIYVSPYNDIEIIAGQGTIGLELLEQKPDIDYILGPVGGGGLIAGIANAIKASQSKIKILGSLPKNSPVMSECISKGHIYIMPTLPTLSDATAGNMDLDSITFPLCKQYVDGYFSVSEGAIKDGMIKMLSLEHLLVEGAVGTAIAAIINNAEFFKNSKTVIIVSGANINIDTLKKIVC